MKAHLSSKMIDSVSVRYQTTRQFTQPINVLLRTGGAESIKLASMLIEGRYRLHDCCSQQLLPHHPPPSISPPGSEPLGAPNLSALSALLDGAWETSVQLQGTAWYRGRTLLGLTVGGPGTTPLQSTGVGLGDPLPTLTFWATHDLLCEPQSRRRGLSPEAYFCLIYLTPLLNLYHHACLFSSPDFTLICQWL